MSVTKVTKQQLSLLKASVGKKIWLKGNKVLGVGREQVKLLSVDETDGTAQVCVPGWGEETAPLSMFVKLY